MPEGDKTFHVRTSMTAAQAREFLHRAAHDDDFRAQLASDPTAALADYGVEFSTNGDHVCPVPSPEFCEQLLTRIDAIDEYAEADYAPIAFAAVVLTVGYAMPLVATT